MSRDLRHSLNLELAPSRLPAAVAFHGARWGLMVLLAALTYLAFPVAGGTQAPVLEQGDVAPQPIIAPFAFDVRKSSAEIEREATALEATARPIYEYRAAAVDTVLAELDSLFAALQAAATPESLVVAGQELGLRLTPEEATYLREGARLAAYRQAARRFLRRELRVGVAESQALEQEIVPELIVRREGSEGVARRDTIRTYEQVLQRRTTGHPDESSLVGDQVYVKLINGLFRPTLIPNTTEYELRKQELRASVDTVKHHVRANERIVDANEVVTDEVYERLFALNQAQLERGGGAGASLGSTLGQILTNALVLMVFWLLVMLYRPDTYRELRRMLVLSLLFGLVIAGAAVNRTFITDAPELIPIPFAAMMVTVLFRGRVSMIGAIVLAILIGSQAAYGGGDSMFIALVGGVAAAVSVRTIRRRNQFLTAVVVVAAAYLVAGVAVGLRVDWSALEVGLTGLRGGLNALASGALAFMLLPVVESISGVTTDVTLLELSDPDRSLLRRLATEAPGTYAHSIAMANLCEPACNAVGANGLLARVGCYYHDIGKLKKPQFFVENQTAGVNPHDKLKPEVSAGIIRNHVRDGIALADEYKLPDVVKDFIPEHHGKMEITYFLERARSRDGEDEVSAEAFRYPGPRPRSVETACALLADGIEAAIRVLAEPTPEKVSDAIDHIIRHRIEAGQLEEAPLTYAQLARMKEEFERVLGGAYHNRIDYPAEVGGIGADWEAASEA
jgi:putative nucleotidyltransferase with HDIG domain